MVRQRKNPFSYRLRLVTQARQHGLKAAARAFQTTRPTVRKWVRRFQAQGLKGLEAAPVVGVPVPTRAAAQWPSRSGLCAARSPPSALNA